ncbi:hypothetical protein FRC14_006348 [Serendipita sp. 396]|nr:hypothetical protein FRC14_006348 [Serendipita sp. 396]KAG8787306.1 hypothetical protein FRC15_009504 [Serendipita sp. 397]KAG8802437.1 hypothetical protein FRC16_009626 [Serendipita sp. 398]KAG8825935.1 hypothetical protein FRC19_010112 [Serendipita sp. 401]KAG8838126.1 hypothetical protein FRC18_006159 [Serendipita sp. 400]KAG8858906.1 hypothetical protein FRB91_009038 [Serendipita sp. 411]KAG8872020.1 hypothetical protein FRC20_009919 [Serendipita sp. 405]KAG9056726.1 hypothetical prot
MESSADDTCVAILDGKRVLSNVVMKQHANHREFGGIHPAVAIEAHQRNMPRALRQALREANMKVQEVDGIAFTRGPGMGGCLSVSVNAAQNLAAALNKPMVGVHHMQAHALTSQFTNPEETHGYPFLTLLISGGHTMIVLVSSCQEFKILASTVDVAIGNAFDKTARMLNISPDPGRGYGYALEKFCCSESWMSYHRGKGSTQYPFPPLAHNVPNPTQSHVFSFSGLTAAVDRVIRSNDFDEEGRRVVACAFQDAAFAQLELKLRGALKWCQGKGISIGSVVISGGVASNVTLRQRLDSSFKHKDRYGNSLKFVFPPPEFCTDNAAMIAWASMYRFLGGDIDEYGIQPLPKWSIEELGKTSS